MGSTHTGHVKDNIYLSGWEYNRLLQDDPLVPRNSALPAEILWNGAAPLWLFRHALCTKEALDNEIYASEELGWASGTIFAALESEGILETCDWQSLSQGTQAVLRDRHRELLEEAGDSAALRSRIRTHLSTGGAAELDDIKTRLLEPIVQATGCTHAITPNSLRTWIQTRSDSRPGVVDQVLLELSRPVTSQMVPMGAEVCLPPSQGVTKRELAAQQRVEHEHETPMIPDLLAGDNAFAGGAGYENYVQALKPHYKVYEPLNTALKKQWKSNQHNLMRLREEAESLIWPFLHGEWLPELIEDPSTATVFLDRIQRALSHPRISRFLNIATQAGVVLAMPAAGFLTRAVGELTNLSDDAQLFVATLASPPALAGARRVQKDVSQPGLLAAFYQRAIRPPRAAT